MTALVSSPRLSPTDLVLRWRAWKSANGEAVFTHTLDPDTLGRLYDVPEAELTWMMLEIERLRAAIEGLVKTDGGRQ